MGSTILTIIIHTFPFLSYFIFDMVFLYEQEHYVFISPYARMLLIGVFGFLYSCSLISNINKPSNKWYDFGGLIASFLIVALYYFGYYRWPVSNVYLKDTFTMLLMLPGYWITRLFFKAHNQDKSPKTQNKS